MILKIIRWFRERKFTDEMSQILSLRGQFIADENPSNLTSSLLLIMRI